MDKFEKLEASGERFREAPASAFASSSSRNPLTAYLQRLDPHEKSDGYLINSALKRPNGFNSAKECSRSGERVNRTTSSNAKKISFLKLKKIKVIRLSSLKSKEDFDYLFQIIFKKGKRRLLIESGLIFLKTLLNFKLLNHLYIFKSDQKLKKNGFNNIKMTRLFKLSNSKKIKINLDNEKLYKMRIK